MAGKEKQVAPVSPAPVRQAVKLRKFAAPDELDEKFGVQTQQENHISGVVKTEDCRDLIEAFGVHDRPEIPFPFQYIKKQHGEVWSMRIEPAASVTLDGVPVIRHSWTFMQQYPESVGAAQ